ncbi:hypothetical protein GAGA_0889 [Paraglaciecola agarilytica NO2]|uniref:Winged helix-turn helix domain-containing protein n=1 Tax=Paraglaciecola agarilytica NO2 TaxID=1125747 RepID=A0ABQ0I3B3_9ALTE|nr:hypothetical protein GAGA_0889 [Paraglaciecola agarilytica NO2]
MKQLSQYIKKNAIKPSGGSLAGADIHHHIKHEFGKHYHPDYVYTVLKRLNFSWITSRSKHPKQSQEAQDEFKKLQIETIKRILGHTALDRVDFWFQDEARFGQQNTTTRLCS